MRSAYMTASTNLCCLQSTQHLSDSIFTKCGLFPISTLLSSPRSTSSIMAINIPNSNIRICQYVVKIEAQPNSVQEKSLTSTGLPSNAKSEPVDGPESKLLRTFNVNDHSGINPESPLVVSPTGTASTASSPGTADDIWDSPLPSSHHLSSACSNVALTPLTPQSAHYASPDSTPAPRAYKAFPVKCVEERAAKDALANLNASPCAKTNSRIDATQDEDYFSKPQKLIRNLTKQLEASEL